MGTQYGGTSLSFQNWEDHEFQALLGCAMNSRTAWVGALKKFYEK